MRAVVLWLHRHSRILVLVPIHKSDKTADNAYRPRLLVKVPRQSLAWLIGKIPREWIKNNLNQIDSWYWRDRLGKGQPFHCRHQEDFRGEKTESRSSGQAPIRSHGPFHRSIEQRTLRNPFSLTDLLPSAFSFLNPHRDSLYQERTGFDTAVRKHPVSYNLN